MSNQSKPQRDASPARPGATVPQPAGPAKPTDWRPSDGQLQVLADFLLALARSAPATPPAARETAPPRRA
jgi:hypothetical protein